MPPNTGSIGAFAGEDIFIRIYYDATAPHSTVEEIAAQPLINGPRGWCLDVTNTSGRRVRVTVGDGTAFRDVLVPQGNPVTSGPGRSRTAAALATAGYTTRGSVSQISLSLDV